MKKKMLLAVTLLVATAAVAQEDGDYKKWTITPRVGMAVSDYVGKDADDCKAKVGFAAGVEVEHRLSPLFGISMGAFYSVQGVKTNEEVAIGEQILEVAGGNEPYSKGLYDFKQDIMTATGHISMDDFMRINGYDELDFYYHTHNARLSTYMLDIPLMLNVHPYKGLTVKAGAQLGIRLDANILTDNDGFTRDEQGLADGMTVEEWRASTPVTHIGKSHKTSAHAVCKSFTYSIPVGLSYEYRHVELDARYLMGLGSVAKDGHVRTSTFLITLGYKL